MEIKINILENNNNMIHKLKYLLLPENNQLFLYLYVL